MASPKNVDTHDVHHALVVEAFEDHVPTGGPGVGKEEIEAAVLVLGAFARRQDQIRVGRISRQGDDLRNCAPPPMIWAKSAARSERR